MERSKRMDECRAMAFGKPELKEQYKINNPDLSSCYFIQNWIKYFDNFVV